MHVCNQGTCIKTSFILIKDIKQAIILGTPFLNKIRPFTVNKDGIHTIIKGEPSIYKFNEQPIYSILNQIKDTIKNKTKFICELREEIYCKRIKEKIQDKNFQNSIKNFQENLEKEICLDFSTTFWHTRTHQVSLPYIKEFREENIPTKARLIQMNERLLEICEKELEELVDKKLIKNSSSPWSCATFCVENVVELETGVPRIVINYKPLNNVLQ